MDPRGVAPEPQELPRERFADAAASMADAFLDDPGWVAVGPDDPRRRHNYIRRVCLGVLRVARRWGGPTWFVERDGRVAGVLASLPPGAWPPPTLRALALQAFGPIVAGPAVLWRSLVADNTMHGGHPDEPHLFVWMLTVQPDFQRQGVGRALLTMALARAEELGVRTYLDTANPDNLPYYASFGFREEGSAPLPRGATIWQMHHR
ncbi:MAG: GNAT family N-acetyltransferase [Thermoleophilaceae bacterium]